MKKKFIIFLIVLASVSILVSVLGCISSEYSENFKSVSDAKPSEFISQHSDLVLKHQPKRSSLGQELHIYGVAKYEGNASSEFFRIRVKFYDEHETFICEKTLDNGLNLELGENQSFDLKVTPLDCPSNKETWGYSSIKKYKIGI